MLMTVLCIHIFTNLVNSNELYTTKICISHNPKSHPMPLSSSLSEKARSVLSKDALQTVYHKLLVNKGLDLYKKK